MDPITELEVVGSGDIAAAIDAARPNTTVLAGDTPWALPVARRSDVTVDVHDYEKYQPNPIRSRGTVKALTASGFITTYDRLGDTASTIYANPDRCALVAVLNDDNGARPGWRDHRIQLDLQTTPEWQLWYGGQGLGSQRRFAETIEAGQDEIVGTPNATLMLEIAQEFTASIGGKFVQKGRLANGTVQLAYEETVDAKVGEGLVPVPPSFTVRVRPFYGAEPRDIEARIRYTCRAGELQIGYILHRPDEVKRDAFASDVVERVRAELPDAVVIEGVPDSRTPAGR